MHDLAKWCDCPDCSRRSISSRARDYEDSDLSCPKERFLHSISSCTAIILAISLFEGPDKLLVSHSFFHKSGRFQSVIYDILTFGEWKACKIREVLEYAFQLVGHTEHTPENWVISCYKGQAVYPRVFETGDICQPGYLTLYWAPGLLFFDGEVYNRGIDPVALKLEDRLVMTEFPPAVIEPVNLYPSMRMEWRVIRRDGYLEIYLACGRSDRFATSILSNFPNALILSCPHDRTSPLHRPDLNSRYVNIPSSAICRPGTVDPENFPVTRSTSDIERQVDIIASDGNTDVRMFVMSALKVNISCPPLVVIRNNACLQCCLNLCREAGSRLLIC